MILLVIGCTKLTIVSMLCGFNMVSGNFTGNFAILGFRYAIEYQETPALQPLLEQSPTQIISENILKNSEFSNGIRDLLLKNPRIQESFCRSPDRHQ